MTKKDREVRLEELRDRRRRLDEEIRDLEAQDEDPWQYVLCVDFDGVLHSYASGWQGPTTISDPPVPGAFEWLDTVIQYKVARSGEEFRYFRVCIYSSRSKEPGGIEAMQEWMLKHGFDEQNMGLIEFPTQKPAASLLIDDRAYLFEGVFPTIAWMRAFKPWNKRPT